MDTAAEHLTPTEVRSWMSMGVLMACERCRAYHPQTTMIPDQSALTAWVTGLRTGPKADVHGLLSTLIPTVEVV